MEHINKVDTSTQAKRKLIQEMQQMGVQVSLSSTIAGGILGWAAARIHTLPAGVNAGKGMFGGAIFGATCIGSYVLFKQRTNMDTPAVLFSTAVTSGLLVGGLGQVAGYGGGMRGSVQLAVAMGAIVALADLVGLAGGGDKSASVREWSREKWEWLQDHAVDCHPFYLMGGKATVPKGAGQTDEVPVIPFGGNGPTTSVASQSPTPPASAVSLSSSSSRENK